MKIKAFLTFRPILTSPREGSSLFLYLLDIDQTMSSLLVHKIDKIEIRVYLVSEMSKGIKTHYYKIEKMDLVVVLAARNLRPYFHGYGVLVKTNYDV